MIGINRSLFLAVTVMGALVACKPSPEQINVSPNNIQLTEKGANAQLSAEPVDKNGARVEGVTISWESEDPAVASVDANGMVTAAGTGSTTVMAKTEKLSQGVPVTVSVASAVSVDKAQLNLTPEMPSDTVAASVKDDKGGAWSGQAAFTWTSSDPTIATVEDGKITGVGTGSATVTVTFKELKADVSVTSSVAPAAPTDTAAAAEGAPAANGAPAAPAIP